MHRLSAARKARCRRLLSLTLSACERALTSFFFWLDMLLFCFPSLLVGHASFLDCRIRLFALEMNIGRPDPGFAHISTKDPPSLIV